MLWCHKKKHNHAYFTTSSKDDSKNDMYANQTKWVLSKSFTDNQAQKVQTRSKKEHMSLETNFPQFLHFYSEKMWFISHEILKSDGKMVNVVENAECFQGLGHTLKGKLGNNLRLRLRLLMMLRRRDNFNKKYLIKFWTNDK